MESTKSLQESIDKVYKITNKIYEDLKYNNSLWVGKSFRSYDCANYLEQLKAEKEVLKERLHEFFEIAKLYGIQLVNIEKSLEEEHNFA